MGVSKVDTKLILQAIKIIKKLNEAEFDEDGKQKPLLEEPAEKPIFLQMTLHKIPFRKNIQIIKAPVPHSLVKDTSDVCLIVGDLDKRNLKADIEQDVMHYKSMLQTNGIKQVTEVITLRQLRTEYKPFEAKRQLVNAYDVFLADERIMGCLPRILGKCFFNKRKFPIQINMRKPNLKEQVERALSKVAFFYSARGNNCMSEVAHMRMTNDEIIANVQACVKVLAEKIPGGWDNILGLYLKTLFSKAVPIYLSFGDPNVINVKVLKRTEVVKAEELSTIPNTKVKVYHDGHIKVVKEKEPVTDTFEDEVPRDGHIKMVKEENEDENSGEKNIKVKSGKNVDIIKDDGNKKVIRKRKKATNLNSEGKKSKKVKTEGNDTKKNKLMKETQNGYKLNLQKKTQNKGLKKIKRITFIKSSEALDNKSSKMSTGKSIEENNDVDPQQKFRSRKNIHKKINM